ncbi:MAG: hypothetical protein H7A47_11735 [Verrucomicrobiales bacterium]|nr:hypothetical protein [Verrucomicrobiales bacterium]
MFLRQLFKIAISARALAESPAAGLRMLKPEEPIRDTPTWPQFREIVEEIRRQKLNDDAKESALLVEFMGLAGVGTAECANLSRNYAVAKGGHCLEVMEGCEINAPITPGEPVTKQ